MSITANLSSAVCAGTKGRARAHCNRRLAVAWLSPGCRLAVASLSPRCRLAVASLSPRCRVAVASLSRRCRVAVASLSPRCRVAVASLSCRCRLANSSVTAPRAPHRPPPMSRASFPPARASARHRAPSTPLSLFSRRAHPTYKPRSQP